MANLSFEHQINLPKQRKERFAALILLLALSNSAQFYTESAAKNQEKDQEKKTRYKGSISKTTQEKSSQEKQSPAGASTDKKHEKIFLRVDISKRPPSGLHSDIEPYYTDESGLSAAEYGRLVTSPLLERRLALWKSWYSRLFDEITDGMKIPEGLRAKINLTVSKEAQVTAVVEWQDPSKNPAVDSTSRAIVKKLRDFQSKPWLAFPKGSYLDLLRLDLYLQEDEIHLASRQELDYD